jgi:DNA-binding SARP family transcriptional activator
VGDQFGVAAGRVAQVFNLWQNARPSDALKEFDLIAPVLKNCNYGFLLTRPSHLGFQEMEPLYPIILEAYRKGIEKEWLASLPHGLDLETLDYHPGYGLSIRTLGKFDVWRGKSLTSPREWQREKARQLFQLFISNNGKWISRDQLADRLWPELDADASTQNLKVAFNALTRALEPLREPGQSSFFIIRRDTLYGVNPAASIALDTADFTTLASAAAIEDLQTAHDIYQGDYLFENCADAQIASSRNQLCETYLQSGNRLAEMLFAAARWDDAMHICHDLLAVDPCNESAFRTLMRCHAARGNRSAVHSVFQRCTASLREDLDVEPSTETTTLYKQLTQ